MKKAIVVFTLLALVSCKEEVANPADAIYFGGDIITMEGNEAQYVEAVAVKDGKILFVGSKSEAEKFQANSTEMKDLEGKTLLPGFIDPHSHFMSSLAMGSQANCQPAPAGEGNSVAGIVKALQKIKEDKNIPDGETIIGYGYDDNAMPNDVLLNRDDLDKAFPNNPVIVIHVSMHGVVLNSKAMKNFNINSETQTVEGGIIVRKPGTNEPYGLIMEMSYLPIFAAMPKPSVETQLGQLKEGQMLYAAAGVTTAQEGATHLGEVMTLERGAKENKLFIDVISYPLFTEMDSLFKIHPPKDFGKYNNHLKLGGIKITVDGSPQGRTAFFTTPYLTDGPGGEKNWRGEPSFNQDKANQLLKRIYDAGLQSTFHANGDAAIDMCIKAHQFASAGNPTKDRRTTIIHAQFIRKDQLNKFFDYKLIPSFYTEHTYFFADTHIKLRGLEQTSFISPMKTAITKRLRPTNHTDFNVVPIDQMFVVWSAVNRISRNGVVVGASERITPYQALQAITTNVAYQYFEENSKGSLKVGKLADLVILDQNPLKVEAMKIKDIKVMETFKEGKSIFKK
ncbi:amidohydrolase [Flavobacterium collinsii]|uniref:N-substituted formamide deformylase n=1 Tax=Flavobacterium collinsii TaxID=1114861 RepID=A0ABN7EHT1_9FLAO|nr:amidohydrolase [Flavobacterium collinsii]CAA9195302.1 N-substituted formamide deformylase [Flavobacterium collinsii]